MWVGGWVGGWVSQAEEPRLRFSPPPSPPSGYAKPWPEASTSSNAEHDDAAFRKPAQMGALLLWCHALLALILWECKAIYAILLIT